MRALSSILRTDETEPRSTTSPEKSLIASIVGMAFADLQSNRTPRERSAAFQYLMGKGEFARKRNRKYVFLIENCCRELNCSVKDIRQAAIRMYNNPADFKW